MPLVLVQCNHWCWCSESIGALQCIAGEGFGDGSMLWCCEHHLVAFTHIVPPGQGGHSSMMLHRAQCAQYWEEEEEASAAAAGFTSSQEDERTMLWQCQPTDLVPAPSSPSCTTSTTITTFSNTKWATTKTPPKKSMSRVWGLVGRRWMLTSADMGDR